MAKRQRKAAKKPKPRRAPARRARAAAPASRAVEAALAGIAHDIRTPLTGLVALAELLAASDLGARERGWAEAIKSGAEHLAALSTLIVDAARVDVAGIVVRREPFSPRALAEAVGYGLEGRAANKSITAKTELADGLPELVLSDVVRLRAALENLADNAVKFTDRGSVRFSAAVEKAARGRLRLTFTFADSGIGMSPAELKRLFRPFAQASEDVARRYGGAGLGLVFVRRIAKAMGGDLKVTSKSGKGSTFRLTALVEPAREVNTAATPPQGGKRALSLLCVEDNPYGRVVMNTILRELGHRADFAETGDGAIKAVQRAPYDAVLMDITLPGIDGLETTRHIRALPGQAGQVPVIGISGRADAGDEQAARAAGMNFYLTKPVSPSKLVQALAAIAGQN